MKMIQKLLFLGLALAMLCSFLPAAAAAEETQAMQTVFQDENGVVSYIYEPEFVSRNAGIARASEENLIQLGAPYDLKWGIDMDWAYDEETDTFTAKEITRPGSVRFKVNDPFQGQISFRVFYEGEDQPIYIAGYRFDSAQENGYYYADAFAVNGIPETGNYYFTLTSRGDETQYRDSETVTSDIWHYTKPDAQLSVPTNLYWDGRNAHFTLPDEDGVYGFHMDFLFAETLEDKPHGGAGFVGSHFIQEGTLPDWFVESNGSGYYYFKVNTLSANLEEFCNSEVSELSDPIYISAENSDLDSIVENASDMTEDEIRSAVQGIGAEDLETAMLADKNETEAIAQLKELEDAVGGPAEVEVTDEVSAFDAGKVSVVGANLNTPASETEQIKLVMDKPEKEHVIPEAYDNSVAIRFSMDLDNVENTEELAVPVQITLPIPGNINPEFLVILHYHSDGTVEELTMPYIFSENGQYYAKFVVNSFSDFVLTQYAPEDEETGNVSRIAGTSRVDTALEVAKALKETLGVDKLDAVIIASGEDKSFADALTGSYLASKKGAPILLYRNTGMSELNLEFIKNNLSSDGTVYLLGDSSVVPASVEQALAQYTIKRLAGTSRFDTNLAILQEAGVDDEEILIARGFDFADSLSASATGLPILLVNEVLETLTDTQIEFLESLDGNTLTILGGKLAVSEDLEATIENVVGYNVDRVYGTRREDTSVEIAKRYFPESDFAVVAYSRKCPDGLCGGPLAYAKKAPLLLTNAGAEDAANGYVTANGIDSGYVLGGTLVVSDETAREVFGLSENTVISAK